MTTGDTGAKRRSKFFWFEGVTEAEVVRSLNDTQPSRLRRQGPRRVLVWANALVLLAMALIALVAQPKLQSYLEIALLAVTGRPGPGGAVAASHFTFQQRTLWTGAVAALLGAILIAVGLGVFVLFIVAVWLILRGASGVLTLKAGRPVRNPRGWFLA
jgi:uncharacterized membrane protein